MSKPKAYSALTMTALLGAQVAYYESHPSLVLVGPGNDLPPLAALTNITISGTTATQVVISHSIEGPDQALPSPRATHWDAQVAGLIRRDLARRHGA